MLKYIECKKNNIQIIKMKFIYEKLKLISIGFVKKLY